MPLDKYPVVVTKFKGLLENGDSQLYDDTEIPFDYAQVCTNIEFMQKGGLKTRRAIEKYVWEENLTGRPLQIWQIHNLNGVTQTDRWLILTWDGTSGRLYDTQVTPPATNPILTITGMRYAFVINAFGRMYISPWGDWASPHSSEFIYMYNGLTNARLAGGVNPTVGAFAVAVAAGGNCTPGLHYATVLYEYDTGYISFQTAGHALTPLNATTTTANATMNFTAVPVGVAGSGVVKRHIIITKVVVNPNGKGLLGYEPFFAVTINDNTTTTATFTDPDSALVESAKDHIGEGEKYPSIPSVVSMAEFGNRMIYMGIRSINVTPPGYLQSFESCIYVSPPNNPEQILAWIPSGGGLAGLPPTESPNLIPVGAMFPGKVMIGAELNKILYIFKEDSTFSITADDESDPSEWSNPATVDGGKGAYVFGIARVSYNPSSLLDGKLVVAGNHGISLFDGSFAQDNLADAWYGKSTYTYEYLRCIKLVIDSVRKWIIVKIGNPNLTLQNNPANNLFVGNYYNGLNSKSIRWSIFSYSYNAVYGGTIVIADTNLRRPGTGGDSGLVTPFYARYPLIVILDGTLVSGTTYHASIISECNIEGYDYPSAIPLQSYPIEWRLQTGYTPNNQGEIYTFGPLKLHVQAFPITIQTATYGATPTYTAPLVLHYLGYDVNKYLSVNLNVVSEHMCLDINGSAYMYLWKLVLFGVQQALERARV